MLRIIQVTINHTCHIIHVYYIFHLNGYFLLLCYTCLNAFSLWVMVIMVVNTQHLYTSFRPCYEFLVYTYEQFNLYIVKGK